MTSASPIHLAVLVASILDDLRIEHVLGGSLASSMVGEPRSTLDVDLAARIDPTRLDELVSALRPEFFVPDEAARRAVEQHTSFNVLHDGSGLKVDLFVLGDSVLDRRQIERRQLVEVASDPPATLWVTAPEDQVLRKLEWYRSGGETSDRQWRDVVAILTTQADHLDRGYLDETATLVGLSDLLQRAEADAAQPG